MKRRTLFGLPLVGLFGFWPRRSDADAAIRAEAAAPLVAPRSRPAPFGPTMEQLDPPGRVRSARRRESTIGCSAWRSRKSGRSSGTPAGTISGVSPRRSFRPPSSVMQRPYPQGVRVLVPESLLPYFRPENRGEEFPAGIPFKHMP